MLHSMKTQLRTLAVLGGKVGEEMLTKLQCH